MKKILLANVLFFCAFTVTAETSEPFVGINPVMGMCHVETEDSAFVYHGKADTKLTINDNFVIATCKAEAPFDAENPPALHERGGIDCHVGIPGKAGLEVSGKSEGTGGFTVSSSGVVSAFCKASRQ